MNSKPSWTKRVLSGQRAISPFYGRLLLGFLTGTIIALAVALGILAFIFNRVFFKDQPPKWIGRIIKKR